MLSHEANVELSAPFSMEEIEVVVKDCDRNKSSDPRWI